MKLFHDVAEYVVERGWAEMKKPDSGINVLSGLDALLLRCTRRPD
ncbi:hypothetical protein HMPREF0208_00320 [Citrobacter koseri]|nr:hypothetical protein HMPREF3220_01139 [Citrobacter koseri]KXB47116.1 hypothetical protein HMPREF0208_00320 [Citrobacter koseri]